MESNREGWLTALAAQVRPIFNVFTMGPYRVTCGWPSAQALGRRVWRMGECHGARSSTGGVYEIFISPRLGESIEVAGVVCHEMAHIAAGIEAGHGKDYKLVCQHVGLTRNKPAQAAPGEKLTERLKKIINRMGPYPHKAMEPQMKLVQREPRVLRVVCQRCSCPATLSIKWLERAGAPTCGCGGDMEPMVS